MSDLTALTLVDTRAGITKGSYTSQEVYQAYLKRIDDIDSEIGAYLQINANSKDRGIPVAVKDIINTKLIETTAGSKILEHYNPPFDATVIKKLTENEVSVIGKVNCDELAMGSSGENSAYQITKNPWDLTKVPGGSSSGSAAAVAADLCVFALGSDTGGSIRQPASLCGVVGFKPSYGRISRYGFISMASSLDCPGTFTKSVADAKLVLGWLQGIDGLDSNVISNDQYPIPNVKLNKGLKGVRVGIPKEYFAQSGGGQDRGLNTEVERVIKESIMKLEELGATIVEISLPHTEYAVAVYYIIMASEVSSNLARFDGIRFGKTRDYFGEEVKRRIMLGTFALSSGYYDEYFNKAAKVRTLIKQDFEKAFEICDVIAGPVSPTVAWKIGEKINDPLAMYLSDVYTIPASLAGLPGVSVPCGFADNMPVGLQILGPYLQDGLVLDVAEVYEQNTNWRKEKPKLAGGV